MSSRILDSSSAEIRPFIWRSGGRPETSAQRTTDTPSDSKVRAAELESVGTRRFADGREQGRREGMAEGEKRAMAELTPVMRRLTQSIEEVVRLGPQMRHDAEAEMVRLAIAIAKRVIHRELSVDPAALLGISKAALDAIDVRELHRVRVHPDDARLMTEELQRLSLPKQVEVVGDARLERGAVILETTRGTLDASVGVQLSEIERGLIDWIGRRS